MSWARLQFEYINYRPWREEEIEILARVQEREKYLKLSQEKLANAGFRRSLMAIASKRRDLGLYRRWPAGV